MRRFTSILIAVAMISGCGAGARSAIRQQANVDLACAESGLDVTPARTVTQGDANSSGVYYVEGCGKFYRYTVACNIFSYCPHLSGIDIDTMIRKQAGFDLQCGDKELNLTQLNKDTFGASGCGRQASYTLLCHLGECKVVQNTQSQ